MSTPDDVAKDVIDQAAADKAVADKATADQAATDKADADLTAERDTFKTERDTLKTERDTLKTERDALKAEVDRLEKLTGKAAKPPAAGGSGDRKLTADEWLADGGVGPEHHGGFWSLRPVGAKAAPPGPSRSHPAPLPTPAVPSVFVPPVRERDSVRVSGPPSGGPGELGGAAGPETVVVVPVVRVVVVAVRGAAVVRVVVPTAATIDAVRPRWTKPQGFLICDW